MIFFKALRSAQTLRRESKAVNVVDHTSSVFNVTSSGNKSLSPAAKRASAKASDLVIF